MILKIEKHPEFKKWFEKSKTGIFTAGNAALVFNGAPEATELEKIPLPHKCAIYMMFFEFLGIFIDRDCKKGTFKIYNKAIKCRLVYCDYYINSEQWHIEALKAADEYYYLTLKNLKR